MSPTFSVSVLNYDSSLKEFGMISCSSRSLDDSLANLTQACDFTHILMHFRKGELKEYLVSGITKHDFIRRMRAALEITPASVPIDANVVSAPQAVHGSNTPPDTEVAAPMDARIKAVLEERKLRLEKEKSEHDLKVKKHTEVAGQSGPKGEDARKYALAQSKRLTEAREERARVLQRIKEDKEHRREKDALRKEQLRASSMIQNEMAATASPTSPLQMKSPRSSQCAIQVRLFDGSTIRSSFGSGQTLRTHVRAWIDEHHDGDIPYTFRQVLTPSPNRFIGDSEEDQSLEDVGLCPSATLILIEVKAFAPAYNNGAAGLVKGGIAAGYGIVSSSINLFSGIVGGFLPVSSNQQPAERVLRSTPDARRPARDNTPDEQQEYYNGNSVSWPLLSAGQMVKASCHNW